MSATRSMFAVTALVASFAGASAAAQSTPALAASRALPVNVATTPPGATVADAHRLTEVGRFREARNVFKSIATAQIAAGDYAAEALYGLAQTEYAMNDARAAAATLDLLANEAARFGDPEMRLRATFEASILYQTLGERLKVAERAPLIKSLLKSPVIPDSARREIAARIKD